MHHGGPVYIAAFSPDRKRILTASADKTARIYVADLDDLLAWSQHRLPIDPGQ